MKKTVLVFALIFSLLGQSFGQQQKPAPQPQQPPARADEEEIVRVTTNLVQVDAVVTDREGRPVADLKPEDFEIREDGKAQRITNFSFISGSDAPRPSAPANAAAANKGEAEKTAPAPSAPLRPEQVRRTVALVVDDLNLSFESLNPLRKSLRKFVDEQMQPGDLVAVIRTGGGMGVLQQFTSDKRLLAAAIERVRWEPRGRNRLYPHDPVNNLDSNPDLLPLKELLEQRDESIAVGTFGALGFVVRGMTDLPGRKAVVFYSEALKLTSVKGGTQVYNDRAIQAMRRLTDQANRASVALYTVDAGGLQTLDNGADDSPNPGVVADLTTAVLRTSGSSGAGAVGGAAGNLAQSEAGLARLGALAERRQLQFETFSILGYLAQQTGGVFTRNTNDLNLGIQRALADQRGYYLIGYRPDESTFDTKSGRRNFHKLEIKVKRPGLKARTRAGFFGVTDEEARAARAARENPLVTTLVSPFTSSGVHVRLTSIFGEDASAGSFMNTLIHVDARDLSFTEEPDGWRKAVVEVIAMTFGDNGQVVDQVSRTQTLRVRKDVFESVMQTGLAYNLNVPVRQAGAYQLRVAVRDSGSQRLGSASQFVQVPNLNRGHLTLSGIALAGTDPRKTGAQAQPRQDAGVDTGQEDAEQRISSATRRFRHGTVLDYGYMIYNALLDRSKRPQLQTQVRLFREGRQIFAGRPTPFDPTGQTDMRRLVAGGRLQVGTEMAPGEYILQVVVTDTLSKEKNKTVAQWIDFEVAQ